MILSNLKFTNFNYIDIEWKSSTQKGKCRWEKRRVSARLTSWGLCPRGDESTLERVVALLGPVAVSVNAAPHTFQLYQWDICVSLTKGYKYNTKWKYICFSSGIYDDPLCTSKNVNHAVLVVGYSPTYWIILNWWGKHWGENGYMRYVFYSHWLNLVAL